MNRFHRAGDRSFVAVVMSFVSIGIRLSRVYHGVDCLGIALSVQSRAHHDVFSFDLVARFSLSVIVGKFIWALLTY